MISFGLFHRVQPSRIDETEKHHGEENRVHILWEQSWQAAGFQPTGRQWKWNGVELLRPTRTLFYTHPLNHFNICQHCSEPCCQGQPLFNLRSIIQDESHFHPLTRGTPIVTYCISLTLYTFVQLLWREVFVDHQFRGI